MQQQQQQRRLMSSESNDNAETGVGATNAVDVEGDSVTCDAEEDAAPVAEEATTAPVREPILLVQVDGIPFSLTQGDLEQWLADAGCTPVTVTMPLRPESSNRPGQNKGRAYVEMANEDDVQAVLALGGRSIGERWVNVARLAMHIDEVRVRRVGGRGVGGSKKSPTTRRSSCLYLLTGYKIAGRYLGVIAIFYFRACSWLTGTVRTVHKRLRRVLRCSTITNC